jgi:hypothetical protein
MQLRTLAMFVISKKILKYPQATFLNFNKHTHDKPLSRNTKYLLKTRTCMLSSGFPFPYCNVHMHNVSSFVPENTEPVMAIAGNTKGGSITVPLPCLTGLD